MEINITFTFEVVLDCPKQKSLRSSDHGDNDSVLNTVLNRNRTAPTTGRTEPKRKIRGHLVTELNLKETEKNITVTGSENGSALL